MARIKYRDSKLSPENMVQLNQINSIVAEYQRQDLVLTLRQLYYQLVSRDVIPNQQKEYAKLSKLLKEGRMCGIVDWSAIEDRLRSADKPPSWDTPAEILDSAIFSYAKPRMAGQETYLEVWVEKDALSGVLSRVTEKYHVPICVNRGYSSASAMHEAFKRMHAAFKDDQKIRIIYLGDYDPSGIDMIRDVEHRVLEFFFGKYFTQGKRNKKIKAELFKSILADEKGLDFEIMPIALTRDQIKQYNPPRNPAKKTDPRSKKFIADHGKSSWEVDALRPDVLNRILTEAIEDNIDLDKYEDVLQEEKADKVKLEKLKAAFFGDDD